MSRRAPTSNTATSSTSRAQGVGWYDLGGTSLAAPLWAAFTALTDASSTCAGKAIGFANPVLYKAAAANYTANFTDITTGNNDYTPDGYFGGLYPAGTGYDMATGLGTPNGGNLARALCTGGGAANTVTVTNPGSQTTTVGATVSLQTTATDSGGAALTFSATGLPAGLSISASGLISGTPSAAGAYSVTLTATDTTNASGSATFTLTVNKAAQVISFTTPPTGTVGGSATLIATGGGSGNPVVLSVAPASGAGVCSLSGAVVSYLAAGNCVLDANQAGNANYSAAPQVVKTITVGKAAQLISFNPPATGTVGGSVTLTATGGASGNPVTFSVDQTSGSGVCSLSGAVVSYLAAGSCVIDANQAGNADFTAAQQVAQTITVGQGSQSIIFNPPTTGSVGGSVTLTATGGGSGNPVVFSVDPTSGSGVCSVAGTAVSYLAVGSCVIDANQVGNANYMDATEAMGTITVNGAPAFVMDSPPLTAAAGQPYDYTFTASGDPAPTYALASGAPSWLSVDAGTGEVTGTPPSGTTSFSYAVTATNTNGTTTAGPFTVTVTAATTSTRADVSAVVSCPASMTVGDTGICTLTVANAGPGTASMVVAGVRLPAALSEVSCTANCARHANVFTWSLAALASGDSAQFSLTVKANAGGTAMVLAAAAGRNCDPHPRNNISIQRVTIAGQQGTPTPGQGNHPSRGGWGCPTRQEGR